MKCRIINSSFFCRDEDAKVQESIFRVLRELEDQTKNYSIDQLFGLLVGDVDERFILELIKIRSAKLETELADKDRQLVEARADAEHWKSECNALQRMVHEARAEIESKSNLIKQMRAIFIEMLAKSRVEVWAWESKIKAALAVEGGE